MMVELMCDPVMAAKVLMGWELDDFQAAALRMDWWFPNTIDSSGVSTGKTLRIFILACLRCMLLPDHVCAVYFQNFQMGKEEFWPYFQKTCEKSPIFLAQCLVVRNKPDKLNPGAWIWFFKNASRITMPAPNFLQDAKTAAGRRFNTLIVDEVWKAIEMGDGIEAQLVDRVSRPCFNQNHPIWGNHIHFKGHAQRPSHKGHKLLMKAFKQLIRDGSTRHAIYSFCYKDISPKFAPLIRPDHLIRTQRAALPRDQFIRQWLGIWMRDGSTYYPEVVVAAAMRGDLLPAFGRVYVDEINIGGVDIGGAGGIRSDYSAVAVLRIVELQRKLNWKVRRIVNPAVAAVGFPNIGTELVDLPCNFSIGERRFHQAFTFGFMMKGLTGPETSGLIHFFHRIFGFSLLVLDPGGGGLWVYPHLKKDKQEIGGRIERVTPLCLPTETLTADKLPIVHYFQRGGELDQLVEPDYLRGPEGFLAAMHLKYREAWEMKQIHLPLAFDERPDSLTKLWTPEMVSAQKVLDLGVKQLSNVRQVTNSEGNPLTSKRGFPLFESKMKKDVAYAKFQAFIGGLLWFHQHGDGESEEESGESYFRVA